MQGSRVASSSRSRRSVGQGGVLRWPAPRAGRACPRPAARHRYRPRARRGMSPRGAPWTQRHPGPRAESWPDDGPRHRPRPRQHRLRRGRPARRAARRARRRRHRDRGGRGRERRLAVLHERVRDAARRAPPDAVALEDLYFGRNARSAFAVGQARGVVLLAAGQRGIPCTDYTPQQVKGAVCGSGPRGQGRRSGAWCRRCCRCPSRRSPTTPPTRSPSPSATPTTRRCARGEGRVIALVAGEVAVRRPDHVVVETAGGVGYRLAVSAETLRHVPAVGRARLAARPPRRPRRRAGALRLRHRGGARPLPAAALACSPSGRRSRSRSSAAARRASSSRRSPPATSRACRPCRASASARPSGSWSSCARRSARGAGGAATRRAGDGCRRRRRPAPPRPRRPARARLRARRGRGAAARRRRRDGRGAAAGRAARGARAA